MNRFVLILCAALAATSASAQYPAKPIRLVIGLPAGSAADALARILAQGLGESLGQPVLVENKPGVGSVDTLVAGMLMKATSTSMTWVNYKGPVQSLQDLMAGRIDVVINPLGAQIELAKSARLRCSVRIATRMFPTCRP